MNEPPAVQPRIAPGTRREIGAVNQWLVTLLALGTGGRPANVFTTLARHRGLFRRWLWFASGLMPGGRLPRRETELLILRTAHNCRCEYEWSHHERIGLAAGLDDAQIVALAQDAPRPHRWSARELLLIRMADELHQTQRISDELWPAVRESLSEVEAIEACMLVGHYEMLAMTLNSLDVQPDPVVIDHDSVAAQATHWALGRLRQ